MTPQERVKCKHIDTPKIVQYVELPDKVTLLKITFCSVCRRQTDKENL